MVMIESITMTIIVIIISIRLRLPAALTGQSTAKSIMEEAACAYS